MNIGFNHLAMSYVTQKVGNSKGTASNAAVSFTASVFDSMTPTDGTPANTHELNTSLRWHMPTSEQAMLPWDKANEAMSEFAETFQERTAGTIQVWVGKNELVGLMQQISEAISNGECLITVLQRHNENHVRSDGSVDRSNVDIFWIDPNTGEVKHAAPRGGIWSCAVGGSCGGEEAVWDLAYDLQKFLQLRVFGVKDGILDVCEIERMIAEIKERQSDKCMARFSANTAWLQGVQNASFDEISTGSTEEDEEPEELTNPIDWFINTIGEHQDKLYEERRILDEKQRLEALQQEMMSNNTYAYQSQSTFVDLNAIIDTPVKVSPMPTQEQVNALMEKQSIVVNRRWLPTEDGVTTEAPPPPPHIAKFMSMSFDEIRDNFKTERSGGSCGG